MSETRGDSRVTALPENVRDIPAVMFRVSCQEGCWRTHFVTQNIAMYGYSAEDFLSGDVAWLDFVHPNDRGFVSGAIRFYESQAVSCFRLSYRVLTSSGDSIDVTDYNTINRDEDGGVLSYDLMVVRTSLHENTRRMADDHSRRQRVLNEILTELHGSDPNGAVRIILDRTGEYLNTGRALLFKDAADHEACSLEYEWCNRGVTPLASYYVAYQATLPDIRRGLESAGYFIADAGEIPPGCKAAFEAAGLRSFAAFAIYLDGERYGTISFDDFELERRWDCETICFLRNIANLISAALARQNGQKELEQNRRSFKAVFNNVDSFILVVNPSDDAIIFANRSFQLSAGEHPGGRHFARYFGEPASRFLPRGAGSMAGSDVLFPRTGQWLAVNAEVIVWVDGRDAILVNCYDVTAKKLFASTLEERIEERTGQLSRMTEEAKRAKAHAEEAAKAKSQFLSTMSHEMRTPLNAIIGMTNIAKAAPDAERKDYCIEKIEEASIHLLGVINNILDLSKIEAGKLELAFSEFEFEKLLVHVTGVMGYNISKKSHHLAVQLDPGIPFSIVSDEQRLGQVITNLLANAAKFTPDRGELRLSARKLAEHAEDHTVELEIAVTDNGIGLSPDQQRRLFRSFEQAGAGISRKYGGTGLGLSISNRIVEALGGRFSVASEEGSGSTFRFTFLAKAGTAAEKSYPDVDWEKLRLLVVEDDAEVTACFSALAEKHRFHCELLPEGRMALERVQSAESPFDLVFVHWCVPDMSGAELAARIREQNGPAVVMISSAPWSHIEQESREAGVARYLPKPLFPSMLADCIAACIGGGGSAESPAEPEQPDFSGKRLLLAEDMEINREILIALLEPTGIEIDCAVDGAEALRMFRSGENRYDAVFMDIHMPGVDGFQATRAIRALGTAEALRIPIIAMTASVFREDIERCLESGMNGHVGKPINMDEVKKTLRKYLDYTA